VFVNQTPDNAPLGFLLERGLSLLGALQWQVVWVVLPLLGFALLFHAIEVLVQRRLVQRLGWRAALWTGWIGTPIHEASHVVACWLFGHELEAVALFEPDRQDGRLGYVRHSYQRGNRWQEAGNFFIGVAPLLGGSAALLLVTWAMYPQLFQVFFAATAQWDVSSQSASWSTLMAPALESWAILSRPANLLSPRFWLYLYLALCITLHTAPSASDYRGGLKGGLIVLAMWLLLNLVVAGCGLSPADWTPLAAPAWKLLLTLLALTAGLATLVAVVVYAVTLAWDQVRRA
jgi:hypothetical protein